MNTFVILLAALAVLFGAVLIARAALRPKEPKLTWGERLRLLSLASRDEMRNMYILSATYGMCEIGELFGNLKQVKELLDEKQYLKVVEFHTQFSNAIGNLYNLVFYRKNLRIKEEDAPELFEQYLTEALYAYNRLIEIKNEHDLQWQDPILSLDAMYPVA